MKTLSILILSAAMISSVSFAQDTQTLMGPDTDISFVWGIDLKTGTIHEDVGTLYDVYGGALFNKSLLLGFAGGMNITHPKLNHGYIGLMAQYTLNPEKVLHYSGQILLATASAKGYTNEKSSAMDNMGNFTGPAFYIVEPGVNAELNLTPKSRLVVGLSYRYVTGFDDLTFTQTANWDESTGTEYTFTEEDMRGLEFNIGVKIGLY